MPKFKGLYLASELEVVLLQGGGWKATEEQRAGACKLAFCSQSLQAVTHALQP